MSEIQAQNGAPADLSGQQSQESTELESQELESSEQGTSEAEGGEPVAKETKAEAKKEAARIKKLKLKVDKGEIEEELPFDIPDDPKAIEYMTRQLQMSKVAQKRMAEASQIEKDMRLFIEQLRKDPESILADPAIGLDLKDFAAKIIEREIENSKKSPEQLEKERLEGELKRLQEEREREREELKSKELERLREQEVERLDLQMEKALTSQGLPKSPYFVKKIADYMLAGMQAGLDVQPEDVIPLVKEEMEKDLKEMFAVMPEDVIETVIQNVFGKDVLTKMRKKQLAKAKEAKAVPQPLNSSVKDVGAKKEEGNKEPAKKLTFKEFFGV